MENVIIIAILAGIVGAAVAYIVRAKRRGVKCIGCSAGGNCAHKKGKSSEGGCGCGCGCNGGAEQSSCGCHTEEK